MNDLLEVFPGFKKEYSFGRVDGDDKYHVIAPDRQRQLSAIFGGVPNDVAFHHCYVLLMCGKQATGRMPAMGITWVEPFDSICPGCRAWIADKILRQDFT